MEELIKRLENTPYDLWGNCEVDIDDLKLVIKYLNQLHEIKKVVEVD